MAKKEEYKEKNLQFMSEMAGQDGVSELPCGVLYKEIEKGTGTVSPELNSVVSVHYRGMLINGREFDSSWKRGCPEAFRLKDGRVVVYVIDGYYLADDLNGPWTRKKFDFDNRDRRIIEGLSNLTFAQREDGSYLMVCRGGGVWISQTGLSPYNQITDNQNNNTP